MSFSDHISTNLAAVLLFSKPNIFFSGYFDPEKGFLGNQNK